MTGRRTWSLRARLTALATAVLACGLVVAGVSLVALVSRTQISALERGATRTAGEVAELVDTARLPDPIPADGNALVQVIDSEGRVRAASAGGDRLVPVLSDDELRRARAGTAVRVPGDRVGLPGNARVVGVEAGAASDRWVVLVAVSTRDAHAAVVTLRTALLVTTPILLALLALTSWYVVGLTLRPVDALRAGAEEISGTGGSRVLPVPVARDEIHRLAVTLNDMLTRMDAATGRQRRFVSDAAHELRSPLASIRTQVEVAERIGDWTEIAPAVLADVARLSTLVDDLLLLARLDEAGGRARNRFGPVDLTQLVDDLAGRYVGARVPVRAGGRPGAVTVGDAEGLRRAVGNLVDNAVRHARGRVVVEVTTERDRCVVTVTDDGPGIPEADREKVFDRFTRLDDGRARDFGGAGLGLPIARELLRAHGGTVVLRDAEPGLRAVVRLPAVGTLEPGEAEPATAR